ncbi:MAG: hypothetical protein DRP06_04580, partial [Candidatus Aenigmatarchaeota archaeon]
DDGTKLYVVGLYYERIYEYNLSTPYDISTGVYNDYLSISSQDSQPTGMTFDNDGDKLYIVGMDTGKAYEYNLSDYYDISSGIYNDNCDVSGRDSSPTGVAFNNDGTKLYVSGDQNDGIYEYSLTTPYDISTGVYNDWLNISSQDDHPYDLCFNNDGTKLYIVASTNERILEYNLSSPYDISTGVYNDYLSVSSQDNSPTGIAFNNDGTKLYVSGDQNGGIYEYNLTTPYDISTGVYNDWLNVSSQDSDPTGLSFNDDGTKLYVVGFYYERVYEYNLSSPYDISTGVYNDYLEVSFQDSQPTGMAFDNDGDKLYIVGMDTDRVYEYDIPVTTFSITLNSPPNQTITNDLSPNFNFTVSGNENSYDCVLYLNDINKGSNSTTLNNTATIITSSTLSDGVYNWYINCTAGDVENQSEIREITIDSTSPTLFYNPTSTSQGYHLQNWIFINITASDTNKDSVILEWNGTNETFDNSNGDIYWENKTGLLIGKYTIKVYANDTAGNLNITTKRIVDLYNVSYDLPVLMADSIVKVNENQIYNFSVNVTSSGNITNFQIDLTDYYDETLYSNNSAYNQTVNITQSLQLFWINLTGNTIVQKSPTEISCPTDYTKGNYSGYGYCKKVTGTEDIREVYYIMWINVKDNSSRNYEINFSMPFISEDLSDLISLNYTINNSNKDLSFSTSSKTLTIGKSHSTSSLSEGEYQVKVEFSYLYTGGTTGGGGGGGISAICGNGICEIGETPENCPLDCENATFELNLDHLVLIGHPGSKIKCWGIERGCALKVTNPSEKKIHIRVEIESNDESKNWIYLSLDEENWAQILDFDIVGKSSRWVYFDISVPENVEVERDYQSNLKFTSSNYALSFPIMMRIEKFPPIPFEKILFLLDSTIIKFPRSGFEIKVWHILFISLLLLTVLYPILKGYGMSRKVYNKIKYGI